MRNPRWFHLLLSSLEISPQFEMAPPQRSLLPILKQSASAPPVPPPIVAAAAAVPFAPSPPPSPLFSSSPAVRTTKGRGRATDESDESLLDFGRLLGADMSLLNDEEAPSFLTDATFLATPAAIRTKEMVFDAPGEDLEEHEGVVEQKAVDLLPPGELLADSVNEGSVS